MTRTERLLYAEVSRPTDSGLAPQAHVVRKRVNDAILRVAAWRRYEEGHKPANAEKLAMLERMNLQLSRISDGMLYEGWPEDES